jgi:hypothetical protein
MSDVVRFPYGDPELSELLTTTQAARLLGVDPDTLKRYPIPYHKVGSRGWRHYALADIKEWRNRSRVEG